jgi:hypothetical protein
VSVASLSSLAPLRPVHRGPLLDWIGLNLGGLVLMIQPFADHCKRGVPIQSERAHQVRHRTVHVAPTSGFHPSKEAEETVAPIRIELHETRI